SREPYSARRPNWRPDRPYGRRYFPRTASTPHGLFGRKPHLRRSLSHVGIHLLFKAHEIVAEHAHQLARRLVELRFVSPGLEGIKQVRLNAGNGGGDGKSEIWIGAEGRGLERAVERGRQQRAGHLDGHPSTGAEFATGPAGIDQPAIDVMGGDQFT